MNIEEEIKQREFILKNMKSITKREISRLPKGLIRVIRHGNGFQYYERRNQKDKNGKYVSKKDLKRVKRVAQREYYEKAQKAVEKEIAFLKKIDSFYKGIQVEDVYQQLPLGKRVLVDPLYETDEQFVEKYMNEEYSRLPFNDYLPVYHSLRGLRVRSKSEALIADLLDNMEIPYVYERPLILGEDVVFPDFTLIDVRKRRLVFLEHLGLLENLEYLNKNLSKIKKYEASGYYLGEGLLITGETQSQPLDIMHVELMLNHYFGN